MEKKAVIFILTLILLLSACTPSFINRTTLSENLELVLGLEDQAEEIKQWIGHLASFGYLSKELATAIKLHNDIYYPYYLAANHFLATNQLELYKEAAALAQAELTAIEALIRNSVPYPIPDSLHPQSWSLKIN